MTDPQQPGWYDDPLDASAERYWDGQGWAPHRRRKPLSWNKQPASAPSRTPSSTFNATAVNLNAQAPQPGWWQASDGQWYPPASAGGSQISGPAFTAAAANLNTQAPQPGWWQASDGQWYPPASAGSNQPPEIGIGPAFKYGMAKFQVNAREILIAGGICLLASLVLSVVLWLIEFGAIFSSLAVKGGFLLLLVVVPMCAVIPMLVFWLVQMVMIRGSLMIVNGWTPLNLGQMFSTERIGPFVLGAFIVSALTSIGFMLCYIPGLVFLFFAGYWAYFLIDKQRGPIDAIKASSSLVWANLGTQLLFATACFFVIWLGLFVCYFGLIVALPIVVIAQGYMWRRLQGEPVAP